MSHPVMIGLAFWGDEPCVKIDVAGNWKILPEANAILVANQILAIVEKIRADRVRAEQAQAVPFLIRCPEYGPFIDPERRS